MNRLFTLSAIALMGLIAASGCASTKKGCAGCKQPCDTAKKPSESAEKAPCQTPCQKPCDKATEGSYTNFGMPMKLADGDTVGIKTVMAAPGQFDGKFVRVAGKVDSVCQKRGCWLRLGDGSEADTLFVRFTCPIEGRLIPMEAVGKQAWIEGTFKVTEVSEDEARHYKEDAGASPDEVARIVGPQKSFQLSSPAARIAGLSGTAS